MRNTRLIFVIILSSFLLSSCKQSADVVSNNWLQKRKYRKGFHLDIAHHKKQEKTFELGQTELPDRSHIEEDYSNKIESDNLEERAQERTLHSIPQRIEVIKEKASFWKHSNDEKIQIEEDDPPTQEERQKSNRKKLSGWIAAGTLSFLFIAVGLIINSISVIPGVALAINILFWLSTILFPIAIILITLYAFEHFAIKKNKTIFTPAFLKTMGNISIVFSIIGAMLLIAQVAVLLIFIFTVGGLVDLFAQFLFFLTYLLVLGLLALLYQFTLIFSISSAILSAKKTRQGRISIIIMALTLALTIILFTLAILLLL